MSTTSLLSSCSLGPGILFSNLAGDRILSSLHELTHPLIGSEPSAFTPQELYPCSKPCASQRDPCPSCVSPSPTTHTSPSSRLPRLPLRYVYRGFLDAVRDRLVDDIAEASISKDKGKERTGREVKRFKDGFLLGPLNGLDLATEGEEEWDASWGYQVKMR